MATRIYVGNLPFTVTIPELTQLFAQSGKVSSADIARDAYDGRSRGFGFVEMSEDQEATRAIELLNGSDFKGRTIRVNVATPRGRSKYSPDRYGNGKSAPGANFTTGYGTIYGKDLSRGNF